MFSKSLNTNILFNVVLFVSLTIVIWFTKDSTHLNFSYSNSKLFEPISHYSSSIVAQLLTLFILIYSGYLINLMVNDVYFFEKESYLPGWVYSIGALGFCNFEFHPILIINLISIIILKSIIRTSSSANLTLNIGNSAFLIGVSFFIVGPYISLLIFLFLLVASYQTVTLKSYLVGLLGCSIPFFFCYSFASLMDNTPFYASIISWTKDWNFDISALKIHISIWMYLIPILISFILAIRVSALQSNSFSLRGRKFFDNLILFAVFAIIIGVINFLFLSHNIATATLGLMFPCSIFISNISIRNDKFLGEIVIISFIIITVIRNFI